MISPRTEKRALQFAVIAACIVPLSAGLCGMIEGAAFLGGGNIDLDSHVRYLSGLLFAIGWGFLTATPNIEQRSKRFRLLTFIVFVGGMGRLIGFYKTGVPGIAMQGALIMELVVTPLLCVWQHRLARRFQ